MRAFALALVALFPVASLHAQFVQLQPGARIRLTATALSGRMAGIVASRGRDSITILRNGTSPVSIALADVRAVEISEGKSRVDGAKRGALLGGVVLGALYAAFALGPQPNCDSSDPECLRFAWTEVPAAALAGAAYGAAIGAWVGRERWQRLTVEAPATVAVRRLSRGRVGAGAAISF